MKPTIAFALSGSPLSHANKKVIPLMVCRNRTKQKETNTKNQKGNPKKILGLNLLTHLFRQPAMDHRTSAIWESHSPSGPASMCCLGYSYRPFNHARKPSASLGSSVSSSHPRPCPCLRVATYPSASPSLALPPSLPSAVPRW